MSVRTRRLNAATVSVETKKILDSFRIIVKSLRQASKLSEKTTGIGAAQLFVLQNISESDTPLSINDVAEMTMTHQSTVSVVVKKLTEQGYVERTTSKSDARTTELSVTSKGRKILQGNPTLIQDRLADGVRKMTLGERTGLIHGLNTLIEKAGLHAESPDLFFEDENSGDSERD